MNVIRTTSVFYSHRDRASACSSLHLSRHRLALSPLQPAWQRPHRVAAFATLVSHLLITPEMKQLLMHKANHDEIQALAIEQGMRSLRDGGVQLVADGVTTISEVIRSLYTI